MVCLPQLNGLKNINDLGLTGMVIHIHIYIYIYTQKSLIIDVLNWLYPGLCFSSPFPFFPTNGDMFQPAVSQWQIDRQTGDG